MKKIVIILLTILITVAVYSVPALPVSGWYQTTDCKRIYATLTGDEHEHYYLAADGSKYHLAADGRLVSYSDDDTSHHAKASLSKRHAASSTQKITTFPTTGDVRSVVILVNFTDRAFVSGTANEDFRVMLNETHYAANKATGSARDYYLACSNGQFKPQFDVFGPYNLEHDMAYYGTNVGGVDGNPAQMIVDACSKANADVNFSDYDLDNDEIIDNVFVYYAGYSEAEGAPSSTVWPHRWTVLPTEIYGSNGNVNATRQQCTFDGKRVYGYACTAELKGKIGTEQCGVGVFCHEFGHVLGLVDHYHTASNAKPTLGKWDIMDAGSYSNEGRTPPLFSAFQRFIVGWEKPHQLLYPETVQLSPPSQDMEHKADVLQSCVIADGKFNFSPATPSPSEYFIVEYRKQIGWDKYLPGEGMLVWHIDFDANAWKINTINNYSDRVQTSQSHMGVYLCHPTSETQTPGAAFQQGDKFVPKLWNGHSIFADSITNINFVADVDLLTFDFMGGLYLDLTAPILDSISHVSQSSMIVNWTDMRSQLSVDTTNYHYEVLAYYQYNGDTIANYVLTDQPYYELKNLLSGYFVESKVRTIIDMPHYQRMTPWSNTMAETTLPYENGKQLPHFIEHGQLYIVKDKANEDLLVYDAQGHRVQKINSNVNAEPVDMRHFYKGQVLIFKQGKRTLKWIM